MVIQFKDEKRSLSLEKVVWCTRPGIIVKKDKVAFKASTDVLFLLQERGIFTYFSKHGQKKKGNKGYS